MYTFGCPSGPPPALAMTTTFGKMPRAARTTIARRNLDVDEPNLLVGDQVAGGDGHGLVGDVHLLEAWPAHGVVSVPASS
jgi:hypothetical protein